MAFMPCETAIIAACVLCRPGIVRGVVARYTGRRAIREIDWALHSTACERARASVLLICFVAPHVPFPR
jgi:hypothetical protein